MVENAGVYAIAIHNDYNDHLKAYLKDTLNGKAMNDSRLSKELRAQLDVDHKVEFYNSMATTSSA